MDKELELKIDKNKCKIRKLGLNKTFYTLAITCFDEHLQADIEDLLKRIKKINPSEYEIIAIVHNKDQTKNHYHIIIRHTMPKKRTKVSSILKKLGISFRPGIDDTFIKNRAIETCGDFSLYAVYLLHQTTAAIQEGKTRYEAADFITNLNANDIQEVLNGYIPGKRELSKAGRAHIIDELRKAGYDLKDYNETIESFNILGLRPTDENAFRKSYISGVSDRMHNDNRINRLTIEIEYPADATPSIKKRIDDAIRIAMSDHNCCCTNRIPLPIDPTTEAIIILSDFSEKMFNYNDLSNRRIMLLNRPFTNSEKIWRGSYFIFTHAYINRKNPTVPLFTTKNDYDIHRDYKLIKDSLLCTVENDMLKCIREPDCEFSEEEYDFITNEFKRIRDKFNEAMKQTAKSSNTRKLDIDELNS